jgi:tetrahydromethanopterin S-methyltransferase subunit G
LWFEAVEHRLAEAERLAGGAGTATQRAGSDIPRDLHEQLAADRRRLEAVTERCQRLTTRLGEVEDRLDTPEQA